MDSTFPSTNVAHTTPQTNLSSSNVGTAASVATAPGVQIPAANPAVVNPMAQNQQSSQQTQTFNSQNQQAGAAAGATGATGPQDSNSFQFSNFLQTAVDKLNANSDLLKQRNLLIKQLYDEPLSYTELQSLPQPLQQAIGTGDKANMEMQLRLINDGISGRSNTLNQSINYLTSAYKDSIDEADTKKAAAQTTIENALNRSGSLAFSNYPASVKRQLEQAAGYPTGYLDNVSSTINQTRYAAQYGSGGSDVNIPSGSIASQTNNPLNIKYSELISGFGGTDSGISGQDGGTFAQFSSPQAGLQAAEQLLTSPTYSNLTVDQALEKWSNNGYGAQGVTDIDGSTPMSQLTQGQLDQLTQDMAQRESGATVNTPDTTRIAQAIESGLQPPTTTGLYGKSAAVKAQLAKDGFNLTQASNDWTATQKWLATANNSQQVRLKQAISSVTQGVGALKDLSTQWNAGGFAPLNSANLKLALNGVYGQDAQDLAARFQQQSSIITDELGQTFMGGNSPTDKALSLAGQVFSTSWSAKTLNDALDNLTQNLQYRQNAIDSVGPTGINDSTGQATNPSSGGSSGSYQDYLKAIGQ